ncbi:MAG: YbaB/EbfC family nucleoid-associated protein [Methanocorpusculum sp.]|nr:YbaB/EbfC family nucleoid-associated protein [Methanocorpusculum sp.]
MKSKFLIYSLLLCILVLGAGTSAVSADDTATGQVSVTSLTIDPEVLMPGDTAIVTAVIKNSGTTFHRPCPHHGRQ